VDSGRWTVTGIRSGGGIGCAGSYEACGDGEDGVEFLDGAEGDQVGGVGWESFGADILDLGVKLEGAQDFSEEDGFGVVGFDEGQTDGGVGDLERDTGEARAGTKIKNL